MFILQTRWSAGWRNQYEAETLTGLLRQVYAAGIKFMDTWPELADGSGPTERDHIFHKDSTIETRLIHRVVVPGPSGWTVFVAKPGSERYGSYVENPVVGRALGIPSRGVEHAHLFPSREDASDFLRWECEWLCDPQFSGRIEYVQRDDVVSETVFEGPTE